MSLRTASLPECRVGLKMVFAFLREKSCSAGKYCEKKHYSEISHYFDFYNVSQFLRSLLARCRGNILGKCWQNLPTCSVLIRPTEVPRRDEARSRERSASDASARDAVSADARPAPPGGRAPIPSVAQALAAEHAVSGPDAPLKPARPGTAAPAPVLHVGAFLQRLVNLGAPSEKV